ncbi:MAG TPA: hypothetical protein VFY31_02475 [Macromonas sp.]|nr:hypothetical protein [Macromonas sp.]
MNSFNPRQQSGLALIEAMVAFMVVAVGVLGVIKINTSLLASTGQSKARAEAVALAQDRLERARNFNLQTACTDTALDTPAAETVTGINESFTINTTFTNLDSDGWKDVSICVRWRNGSCTPGTPGDRVLLNSRLACTGTGTSAQIGQSGAQNKQGGFLKTPAGRATTGTNIDYTSQTGDTQVDSTDTTFNTKVIRRSNGDLILVSTDTNKILLITKKLECETQAPSYSTITGKILLQATGNGSTKTPVIPSGNLFPLISEGAVCRLDTASISNNIYPSSGTTEYFWANYKCTVGAEWWGNVGVVSNETSGNISNRSCTGNFASSKNSSTIYSKHPQLAGARAYRGYRTNANDSSIIETVGIGETNTVDTACTATEGRTVYVNTAQNFVNHHFAVWTLNGNPADSDCDAVATAARVNDATNTESTTATTDSGTGVVTVTAHRNPGKYYCMSNTDGVSCQYATPGSVSVPTITISGKIYPGKNSGLAVITGIESPGVDCSASSFDSSAPGNTYSYSCTLNWQGSINSFPNGWSGSINFLPSDATYTLCATPTDMAVAPATYSPTVSVNNSTKALDVAGVDKSITSIVFNFTARNTGTSCPTTLTNN